MEGKEEKKNEKKQRIEKGEKKTNRVYVIKLGINLNNIEPLYNVTPIYYLVSRMADLFP